MFNFIKEFFQNKKTNSDDNNAREKETIVFNIEHIKTKTKEVLGDEKRWSSITKNKIKTIEYGIRERAKQGFYSYIEYLSDYQGENMSCIRSHFENLGFTVLRCERNVESVVPYVIIKIVWN